MKRPLHTALISASAMGLISASTFVSTAWAVEIDCPLHKRLTAQKIQQLPVVSTASLEVTQQELTPVVSASVSSVTHTPSTLAAPTLTPQVEQSAPIGDTVIVKEARNNYGSGTSAENLQTSVKSSPHAAFTTILNKYVSAPDRQGLTHFNYGGLKANSSDRTALDRYIKGLEGVNPNKLSANAAIAYYANLYNAVTVKVVTDNYPLKSIRKLGSFNSGPWKKDLFTINGVPASLDKVEHGILRKKFPSPYIHYMVNCASVGCPNLPQAAWEENSLDRIRVQAARDYINSPRGVMLTPQGLKVSSIFKWFKEDFGGNEQGIIRHIRQHANPELAAAIDKGARITDYGYDWSLND